MRRVAHVERLLEKTEPKAEFFLEKDHTVTIKFFDAALKPVLVVASPFFLRSLRVIALLG